MALGWGGCGRTVGRCEGQGGVVALWGRGCVGQAVGQGLYGAGALWGRGCMGQAVGQGLYGALWGRLWG